MTLLSQAEYARRIGVSRPAIAQWKKAGHLVMQGSQVDVEATDALLKRYRRGGLPKDLAPIESVKRPTKNVKQTTLLNTSPVSLTISEIAARLAELDWKQDFDWSEEAQAERALKAAACIGWEAVTSPLRDDGHWGGYQLRTVAEPLHADHVVAGHGFELDVWEVLCKCRDEISPPDEEDEVSVRLDLLSFLARPFNEHDTDT